jgi:hypothetical protein
MMDGRNSKAVRSEIHSPEARGVNSAVWVWNRAGHKGQGTRPSLECPSNLSWVLAPDVRYCEIKTATCGKERFIRHPDRGAAPPPPRSGSSGLGELGSVLYKRGQAMGEGESLWSLIICDHQMEQVNMPG